MRYCQDCGTGHDCEAETGGRTDPAVEIARIEAERDIKVAQISARQDKAWNETRVEVAELEADAEVAAAVAEAEVVGAAIEAGVQPEPEPVIVDAPVINDDGQADDAPPPVEGSVPPAARHKTIGLGAW